MNFLTLDKIKKQCRIDTDFTEEDDLLTIFGDAAEELIHNYTHQSIERIFDEYGEVPKSLEVAALMYAADLYKNREATGNSNVAITPNKTVCTLLGPYIYSYCEE